MTLGEVVLIGAFFAGSFFGLLFAFVIALCRMGKDR